MGLILLTPLFEFVGKRRRNEEGREGSSSWTEKNENGSKRERENKYVMFFCVSFAAEGGKIKERERE